jgi:hypothetical protein
VHGRQERVPLVADGLAVIEVATEVRGLLLEQDQGTVPVERMAMKYRGYVSWWESGGPARRFGLKNFRVVTVAPSSARLERLREAAQKATGGSRFLWFALQADVTATHPERLLEPIWSAAVPDSPPLPLFAPRS